jgi:hypothetical protein
VEGHRYRSKRMVKYFIGTTVETGHAPKRHDEHYVYNMVKSIKVTYGKKTKDGKINKRDKAPIEGIPFKEMSIFFKYLPYWPDLVVRHSIDGMHIKNVFESVIGQLMDIKAKTKDGVKSREDLILLQCRLELHPQDLGNGRHSLPTASDNLSNDEKRAICLSLKGLKVPIGFSSNIKRLVSMKDLSLTGFNAHDCHMMLTVFLSVAIRAIKHLYTRTVITRMCYFFNQIGQKEIHEDELGDLKDFMAKTMGQMEQCFPPSFFDIMAHLMMHMVDQIRWLGPMYLHEMWPYERFMSILNRYVHNRAHLEGSMIERYCAEEVIEACQDYLREEDRCSLGLPVTRHKGRLVGKGSKGRKAIIDMEFTKVEEAHSCVLQYLMIIESKTVVVYLCARI